MAEPGSVIGWKLDRAMRDELLEKFLKLTAHRDRSKAQKLFSHLAESEKVADFSTLDFAM